MYYSMARVLVTLNQIATEQAAPTTDTISKTNFLMDYLFPTNPILCARDMILKTITDAAYLVQPKARSWAAAHYHLDWKINDGVNGAIDVLCNKII